MSKKKAKVESVVIVAKLPADARRNLAKLERRKARPASVKGLKKPDGDVKKIIAIYRDEGADAVLGLAKHFKRTRRELLLMLASFER